MEYIKDWLRSILYINILLLLCDNLMQKTAYEKYYRFLAGFLLVLCLIKPVLDLVGTDQLLYGTFLQEELNNELHLLKNSKAFGNIEENVRREYEASYTKQIREVAQKYGVEVKDITFLWNTNKNTLRKLKIKEKSQKDFSEIEQFKKMLGQLYNLEDSYIVIEVE